MLKTLDSLLFRSIAQLLPRLVEDTGLEWISTTLSSPGDRAPRARRPGQLDDRLTGTTGSAVEVSEDTIVDDTARKNIVAALAELGIQLTVGQFGTGPSSMLSLGRYPAVDDQDRPVVHRAGIGRRHEDTVIVASVAGLGEDLGLEAGGGRHRRGVPVAGCSSSSASPLGEGRLIGDAVPAAEFLERGLGRGRVGEGEPGRRLDELAGRAGA